MCSYLFYRPSAMELPVTSDVEMIPDVAESTVVDVVGTTGFRREGFPLRRSTAMNDNQCDSSHQPIQLCIPNIPPMAVATVMMILRTKLQAERRDDELLIINYFKG